MGCAHYHLNMTNLILSTSQPQSFQSHEPHPLHITNSRCHRISNRDNMRHELYHLNIRALFSTYQYQVAARHKLDLLNVITNSVICVTSSRTSSSMSLRTLSSEYTHHELYYLNTRILPSKYHVPPHPAPLSSKTLIWGGYD